MSDSNIAKEKLHKFHVELEKPSRDTRISILDGNDRLQFEAFGSVETRLPKGLYTIRTELYGNMEEYMVRHVKATEKCVPAPKMYSSALLENFASSHEYYTAPAVQWSRANTYTGTLTAPGDSNGGIFIFLRYGSSELARKLTTKAMDGMLYSLLDKDRKTICPLEPMLVKQNNQDGWLAFSADLSPGLYFLRYSGTPPREIPLYIYGNWQTQVFVMLHKQPLFAGMRVFMGKCTEGFRPENRDAHTVDAVLKKLQNNEYSIQRDLIQTLAYGNFDNPIAGILAAYVYLKSDETKDNELFGRVLENLEKRILKTDTSPDIQALKLLAARHFGTTASAGEPALVIETPPMLRLGLETIFSSAVTRPGLVPENCLNERIASKVYVDSPWSSWEPLEHHGPGSFTISVPAREVKKSLEQKIKMIKKTGFTMQTAKTKSAGKIMRSGKSIANVHADTLFDNIYSAGDSITISSKGRLGGGKTGRGGRGNFGTLSTKGRFGTTRTGRGKEQVAGKMDTFSFESGRSGIGRKGGVYASGGRSGLRSKDVSINKRQTRGLETVELETKDVKKRAVTVRRVGKVQKPIKYTIDWVTDSVLEVMLKRISDGKGYDLNGIAESLGLPPSTVKRTVNKMVSNMAVDSASHQALADYVVKKATTIATRNSGFRVPTAVEVAKQAMTIATEGRVLRRPTVVDVVKKAMSTAAVDQALRRPAAVGAAKKAMATAKEDPTLPRLLVADIVKKTRTFMGKKRGFKTRRGKIIYFSRKVVVDSKADSRRKHRLMKAQGIKFTKYQK
ncbi:MAG: hypothetical protein GY765_37000 [bacterium]|nr:hypothetical protein [bacterium]